MSHQHDERAGEASERPGYRLVLGSASPARLSTLRAAGLAPEVIVSGVDEEAITAASPAELAQTLARLKAEAVAAVVAGSPDPNPGRTTIGVACDSVLELAGRAYGKPESPEVATAQWQLMRGATGTLHTGHHVIVLPVDPRDRSRSVSAVGSTLVRFASPTDAEIEAYVASGEPLRVAGAFTLDGLGGAFVAGVEGDPHNVVGISLPLLRDVLGSLGISWTRLWR